MKRHLLVEGNGIPIYTISTPANVNDSTLLLSTLPGLEMFADLLPDSDQITVHLDAGYDSKKTRHLLDVLGCEHVISKNGTPLQAGERWKVERAHSWFNAFAAMRVCRERNEFVYAAWVALVNAIIVIKKIVTKGWTHYRWEGRPETWPRAYGRSLDQKIKRIRRLSE